VSAVLDLAAVLLATGRDPSLSLVGEGWGAHVALAVAQWEPKLVAAMAVYHGTVRHGRFPYEGRELKALELPVVVAWAEAGKFAKGREFPPEDQGRTLARTIPGGAFFRVRQLGLEVRPPKEDAVLLLGGWASKQVFAIARGEQKYKALAAEALAAAKAGDSAPTRGEAKEFRDRAAALRAEIDQCIHQNRMHRAVASAFAAFFRHHLIRSPSLSLPHSPASSLSKPTPRRCPYLSSHRKRGLRKRSRRKRSREGRSWSPVRRAFSPHWSRSRARARLTLGLTFRPNLSADSPQSKAAATPDRDPSFEASEASVATQEGGGFAAAQASEVSQGSNPDGVGSALLYGRMPEGVTLEAPQGAWAQARGWVSALGHSSFLRYGLALCVACDRRTPPGSARPRTSRGPSRWGLACLRPRAWARCPPRAEWLQ